MDFKISRSFNLLSSLYFNGSFLFIFPVETVVCLPLIPLPLLLHGFHQNIVSGGRGKGRKTQKWPRHIKDILDMQIIDRELMKNLVCIWRGLGEEQLSDWVYLNSDERNVWQKTFFFSMMMIIMSVCTEYFICITIYLFSNFLSSVLSYFTP